MPDRRDTLLPIFNSCRRCVPAKPAMTTRNVLHDVYASYPSLVCRIPYVQVIRNTFSCALNGSERSGDGFTLMFQGHRTPTLAINASSVEVWFGQNVDRNMWKKTLDSPIETVAVR